MSRSLGIISASFALKNRALARENMIFPLLGDEQKKPTRRIRVGCCFSLTAISSLPVTQ
jgi:hypothetical protein